ncbi:GFA family protein [uncultured Tateyamaria sp.]|uniref:GFA family protein n=1 Tax=uncultured Tateyamaria sp. TaxID=455651 RepID=UPI00261D0E81|nr:GFA family protein [uncultured Tateyamaria sp.]
MAGTITGGCQCGAVRFAIDRLGTASICHCRMCQKAFGNFFATLVYVEDVTWTRGERAIFQSSDTNWRGFCKECGTPLTYEFDKHIEIAVGALDNPDLAAPTVQVNAQFQRRCFSKLGTLPEKPPAQQAEDAQWNASVVSHQHPDHDT